MFCCLALAFVLGEVMKSHSSYKYVGVLVLLGRIDIAINSCVY